MRRGFFPNAAFFPAVGMKRAGIRLTLTLHQTLDDIRALVGAIEEELPRALEEEGSSLAEVRKAFRLHRTTQNGARRGAPERRVSRNGSGAPCAARGSLTIEHERSIERVPADLWDACLGDRGSFTWRGLSFLEAAFRNNCEAENNWDFHYFVVRDADGAPVLATFFSSALWKDDMLATHTVSHLVEERRSRDPGFLTSRVLAMGSLMTEGDHLYLDRDRDWQSALRLLLQHVEDVAAACGARTIALRDLPAGDAELESLLTGRDFVKLPMPESMVVEVNWRDDAEFLAHLSPKARRHQRHETLPWEAAYEVEVLNHATRAPSCAELAHFYALYREVKSRNLSLNTFDLPETLFERMLAHEDWELVLLRLRPEFGGEPGGLPVAVGACFVGPAQYVPMVIGLDYRYVRSRGLYRQCLLQTLRRARHHGLRRILLGMGASLEKRRFGAKPQEHCVFMRTEDTYHLELLADLTARAGS